MSKVLASLLLSAVVALSTVLAEETLFFINKPSTVELIDCTSQHCKASLDQIGNLSAAAALVAPSAVAVPWIKAFGLTADTRPDGVLVAVYSEATDALPKDSSTPFEIPLEAGQGDWSLLEDEHIRLSEVDAHREDVNERLSALKAQWGDNVLVLGLKLTPESHRMRREANDSQSGGGQTASGPPANIYNFRKEGSAASFEFAIWFAIIFALAVFFICILLMRIDEGDDSIIYKTTSAKMGKRD